MTLESQLGSYLVEITRGILYPTDSGTEELPRDRVAYNRITQNLGFPQIVFNQVSTVGITAMEGSQDLERSRWQVSIYAYNLGQIKVLRNAIKERMPAFQSAAAQGGGNPTSRDLETRGIDDYATPVLQVCRIDYFIWHGQYE